MKKSEREARETLAKKHGVQHTTTGSVAGNMKDEYAAPTTVLRHGPVARMFGRPPKEELR